MFQPPFFPRVLCTRSSGSGATRPPKSTALVHFGTRLRDFRSFNLSIFTFSQSAFTQSSRSVDACLPQIDDHKPLRLFGLREFQTLHLHFLPECFHPKFTICHVSPRSDGYDSLRLFGLREFQLLHTHFLPECFHPKSTICRRMSPTDRRLQIASALRASGVSTPAHSLSPGVFSPEVADLTPPIPLDDGRSLTSSGLRRILTPVCTMRLKSRALFLDPTIWNDLTSSWMDLDR
jgi:hypothetical protein